MPVRPRVAARFSAIAALVILLVGCGSTASPAASSSAAPSDLAVASPGSSTSPAPIDTIAPSQTPSASPAAVPSATPRTWSKPRTIAGLNDCLAVVAAIDSAGGDHLAAGCSAGNTSEIRTATSLDGQHWTATVLPVPAHRYETDPELAFEGSTLYLAYSRLAPTDGGCGDDGLADVGVYIRSRELRGGTWSAARQIGSTGDELQSFRVSNGVAHATVANDRDGKTYYESVPLGASVPSSRIPITGAAGIAALRIGDDGAPRIAFESAAGIAFGTVTGGAISTATIPSSSRGWDPALVLEPGNVAHVLWSRSYHGGGCTEPGPLPDDGTYYSTNAGGSWHTTRLSKSIGGGSLTVDPATGTVHALVTDFRTAVLFERVAGGDWSHATIARGGVSSVVIRQDPTTGTLLVAFVASPGAVGGDDAINEVQVMTRG